MRTQKGKGGRILKKAKKTIEADRIRKECIECGNCTKNCDFLTKYSMDLKGFTNREDLRSSCFLCDKCYMVCPMGLSGRKLALEQRENNPRDTGKVEFMKNKYKFRNNSSERSETLLFLGCNYPGTYPKTCEKLIEICAERGIDYSVDCCKKPVVEQAGEATISNLTDLFKKKGTKKLICTCPNCYHLLKERLDIEVISVYQFLYEEGIGNRIKGTPSIYFPCSDRITKEIFTYAEKFLYGYKDTYKSVNCCGLGGGAKAYEPDLVEGKKQELLRLWDGEIFTYCASCSGIFRKYGLKNIRNLASEILGVSEPPSDAYGLNIIKYKFKGRK